MRQQDIVCCKCGKFILTEQEDSAGRIKCTKGRYEDGIYDKVNDKFFCKKCGKNKLVRRGIVYGK